MSDTRLWGGRFSEGPSALLAAFNDSFSFDRELFAEDVEGSIAWAEALAKAGDLTKSEARRIVKGLKAVLAAGLPAASAGYEDVHSYVESALRERIGALAGKLHTGRSRNDQVATDLRLWLKKAAVEAESALLGVADALAARAEAEHATPLPGYTHLKRAEPVTFGHWCLAYVEMLLRDAGRFRAARERGDECPLGSGALSGTPLRVDRKALADRLCFARPTANSLDAVADRDFAAEYLFAASLAFAHLSRLAEDVIFFSSDEAGFVELPDTLATGSSRMPHKKNPDLLELLRGHAGRALGHLAGFLALLKGLPLAYDKDLQLDKEPLFATRAALGAALPALAALVPALVVRRDRMAAAASDDRLLATELADALAKRGVPFRKAHEVVGERFAEAHRKATTLAALGPSKEITAADLDALRVEKALGKRRALGGTAPALVARAAKAARRRIASMRMGERRTR